MLKKILNPENERLVFILITMFLNFLGFSVIIPILPFLVEKFLTDTSRLAFYIGILFSAYAFCQFLASPAIGALSDLWGRRPILLISLLGSIVGYLFLALGGSFWMILIGRVIDGLTGGNISTVYAYVADITDPKHRSKYYGMLGAAGGFGFMIGPALGGILGAIHLTLPLYVAAGITLLNMIWGYFVLPESLKKEHRLKKFEISHLNPLGHIGELFRISVLKRLLITSFIFFTGFFAIYSVNSVYAKDQFAWGTTQIGILLFVVGVVDIIAQGILIRKLIPIYGEVKLSAYGLVLSFVGIVLAGVTSVVPSVLLFYIGFIIMNFGDGILEPSASGLVANSVGPGMQGRVQGGSQAISSISRVVGPLLATGIYGYSRSLPFALSSILFIFAGITFYYSIPEIKSHHIKDA
jgi:MFS transporter, DHA1 family, tetracycline resistance protein